MGVVGLLGCEEPVRHLILQPKLLYCVRSHVDLCCSRSFRACSRPDKTVRKVLQLLPALNLDVRPANLYCFVYFQVVNNGV